MYVCVSWDKFNPNMNVLNFTYNFDVSEIFDIDMLDFECYHDLGLASSLLLSSL